MKPPELPKSLGLRLHELTDALCIIRDAVNEVRKGKPYFLVPIYGQLRALLSKADKNVPLLSSLAQEVGFKPKIYCLHDVNDPAFPLDRNAVVLMVKGAPFTLHRILDAQQEKELDKFMKHKLVRYKERSYSVHDLVRMLANKAGGAHYDPSLPAHEAELMQIDIGTPVLADQLLQIAECILAVGGELLRKVTEFELFFCAIIPNQHIGSDQLLAHFTYPGTSMQMTLGIDSRKCPFAIIADMRAQAAKLTSDRQITFDHEHIFVVALSVDDNLSTTVRLLLDGQVVASAMSDYPLQFRNDLDWFDRRVHVEGDGKTGGTMKLGMKSKMLFNRVLNFEERGRTVAYFRDRRDEKVVWFQPGSLGLMPPGQRDITMEGNVILGTNSRARCLREV